MAVLNEDGLNYLWGKITNKVDSVTAEDIGAVPTEKVGTAEGVASLNESGKVPLAQIPDAVKEVIEGYLANNRFYSDAAKTQRVIGEKEKLYIDLTTNNCYRWDGGQFVGVNPNEQVDVISNKDIDRICS